MVAALELDFPTCRSFRGFTEQDRFVYSDARFAFAGAAVRTGKTYAAARAFVRRLLRDYESVSGPAEYWCIAPTLEMTIFQKRELLNLIPRKMIDWARQGEDKLFENLKRGGGKMCLVGGRTITFRSAEHPESLVGEKVRGVWWMEIARSKYAAWPNVRSRLSNYSDSWLIGDTSPYGRCWFYTELWDPISRGMLADAAVFTWRAVDSPYVPREEIEAARRMLPPEFFKRDYEASWATFSGQIYSGFSREIHMRETCPFTPQARWIFADLNVTADNPACWLDVQEGKAHRDRSWTACRLHARREYSEHFGLDFQAYAAALERTYRLSPQARGIVVDPSMPNDFKEMLRGRGLSVTLGVNAMKTGIREVGIHLHARAPLDIPCLTISDSCTATASEFEGWSWKRSAKGVVIEEPDKEALDPHHLDALRYGIMAIRRNLGARMETAHAR